MDLPTEAERRDILALQLARRRREAARFPLDELARRTVQFSGAELEQLVLEALAEAFAEGGELEGRHLLAAAQQTTPLAVTLAEEVTKLRAWAATRARPAS